MSTDNRPSRRVGAIAAVAFAAALVSGLAACDDDITATDWSYVVPDTVLLYSLSNAEYFGMPSAYDFAYGGDVVVELEGSGSWDLAVANELTTFLFLMPGAIQGQAPTSSIIAIDDTPFDAIERAPTEGYDSTSVVIDPTALYVVRTRAVTDVYGYTCRYYAKLEPIAIDTAAATLTFRYLANPNCNSRSLIPSEDS